MSKGMILGVAHAFGYALGKSDLADSFVWCLVAAVSLAAVVACLDVFLPFDRDAQEG